MDTGYLIKPDIRKNEKEITEIISQLFIPE